MLGVTTTSGPGFVLKQEALGLAVMTELPLVVVDVQRGGPSTGMPTKIEQGDLLTGAARAELGLPGRGARPLVARRLLPRHDRGLHAGREVHDAGRGALRRLPREQRRALARSPTSRRCRAVR